jgi:hypothetical protein
MYEKRLSSWFSPDGYFLPVWNEVKIFNLNEEYKKTDRKSRGILLHIAEIICKKETVARKWLIIYSHKGTESQRGVKTRRIFLYDFVSLCETITIFALFINHLYKTCCNTIRPLRCYSLGKYDISS